MSEKSIKTRTVNRDVATSNPIKLNETAHTKVGFIPTLHGEGVRGKLVKYKKTASKNWGDLKETDFKNHPLGSYEKVTIDLGTEAIKLLAEELRALEQIVEQGINYGETEYVVTKADKVIVINDENKASGLKQILEKGLSEEFWSLISGNNPDLADRLVAGRIQQVRAETISELKKRLNQDYPETSGSNSWQKWIFENHWLFGVNYQKPIEKQKINLPGVMPDYLFPRIDGFVDLLEIKLPKHSVIKPDSSHPGSFIWAADTNKAIGQVAFYLSEIDRHQLEIERIIGQTDNRKISMLKPRAYILIGNSKDWTQQEHDGLRRLNNALHGIEVLTYQELIQRGGAFLVNPSQETSQAVDEIEIPF